MKGTFTIILLFCFSVLFGQQLKFNNENVDSIVIKSDVGAYQFDDKGTFKGKQETIIISYDKVLSQYVTKNCYLDNYEFETKTEINRVKTKIKKPGIGKQIDSSQIMGLLNGLSQNKNTLSVINLIDSIEFRNLVNEKRIRKVAKKYKIDWQFRMKYTTKTENQVFFKSCQSLDTLKIYLSERFDSAGYVMITDYSNTINVIVSTTKKEYRFEGKYPNPLKQPWYNYSDTTDLLNSAILNLDINISLDNILPNDFLLRKSISKEALIDDYLVWYFERREMK
jgi:hypothetical protein